MKPFGVFGYNGNMVVVFGLIVLISQAKPDLEAGQRDGKRWRSVIHLDGYGSENISHTAGFSPFQFPEQAILGLPHFCQQTDNYTQ